MKIIKLLIHVLVTFTLFYSFSSNAEERLFYQEMGNDARYQESLGRQCHDVNLDDSQWPTINLRTIEEKKHYCIRVPVEIKQSELLAQARSINLKLLALASADIYWDGEHLGNKGTPATNVENEVTGAVGFTVPLSKKQLTAGTHLLSFTLSTYHHTEDMHMIFYTAMLIDDAKLGNLERIEQIPPILLIGAMLLLVIFFQFIYWLYQRDTTFLLFSGLSLFSALLIGLEQVKYFYPYPWDWHIIRLKIIIATGMVTSTLLVLFYIHFYKMTRYLKWVVGLVTLFILTHMFVQSYDGKSITIFGFAIISSFIINLIALKQGRAGAKINSLMLAIGLLSLVLLPFSFVDKWFAALFAIIALANLFSLVTRFGHDRSKALISLRLEAEMLRRNLQPHFLMNSLMLIVEWIETQPKQAVDFVEALAEEFRLLNHLSKEKLVPLQDELSLCEQHFEIMKSRYQAQITLVITAANTGTNTLAYIPPATLHTILENAFSHNQVRNDDPFEITIVEQDNRIDITVVTPHRNRNHQGTGTGESYIKTRLTESFEQDWHYSSYPSPKKQNTWITKLNFPKQRTPEGINKSPVATQQVKHS